MSPSLLAAVLLILVVALSPHYVSAASVINETCKAVERVRSVDYRFCMETLYAVPKSTSADTRELALLAANLTKINITSIIDITEDLVNNLIACIRYYREMKQSVTGSIGDIKARNIENAIDKLQHAEDTPDDCDILLFEGRAMKNPLRDENLNAKALAELAYSITSLLENKK
ncbi:uncharacterized protein LOC109714680 [Ananas comosus]|uniref:Uncharacterized protein LOC109714680 n=1 Tax=Ananas comosus TaxID=4615 RepID=A0A6P5FG89_ANACO|nr:uncharacterized protein LOC109714680 [Ananas comosus]